MEQPEVVIAPRSLKERQRQEREALILQVAEEVLMEKGYYETSIDEIASRVGIAKGTVYLHFPSKEDLIVAIVMKEIRQLIVEIETIADTEGSAQSKLELILQRLYGTFVKRMQLISGMFHSVAPHQLKEQGKKIMAQWEQAAEVIQVIVEQGKAAGEFTTDIPTSVMVSAFFSLLSPGSYARLMLGEKIEGTELAKCLGRIYCKGIANLEGGSR
jgi:TetR/AcrR family transcriptional regulator, fatty acid metabolism regulator protein